VPVPLHIPKYHFSCINCGRSYPSSEVVYTCKHCGGLLDVVYDFREMDAEEFLNSLTERHLSIWRYFELLPIENPSHIVSLSEGYTPLYRSVRIARDLGMRQLNFKYEGANPTGSFKDRGMSVGVSKALSLGSRACVCASTGNTSASMAAYATRAGLLPLVILPKRKVAIGKVAQAIAYGAKVIYIDGSFDDALLAVKEATEKLPVYLLNSINPLRLEGQKTLAFELFEQLLHSVPDVVVVPVGNAGNISAIWKGFVTLKKLGISEKLPRMVGVQAEGASPIVSALMNDNGFRPVESPNTVATAIRIGNPVNWPKAVAAIRDSGGCAVSVKDDEIIRAQKDLARGEGLFVEPASAASLAGLRKCLEEGLIDNDESSVLVLTGSGLKDPDVVGEYYEPPMEMTECPEGMLRYIGNLMRVN